MIVKIYLRAIVKDGMIKYGIVKCGRLEGGKDHLAMFDSNHFGAIDDLITDVPARSTIIWKLDCCSGIKSITRIYSKEEKHTVFTSEPKKLFLSQGFKLRLEIPEEEVERKEKYTIECILYNNKKLIIDPVIRVPPPDTRS
ncbi:MAG: hypothetical protein ACM3RX_10445 [Methanococcaceae archaeon]